MAPSHAIEIVLVVSGVPRPTTVQPSENLHAVVEKVLQESGDTGRSPNDFELRTEAGVELSLHQSVASAGIVAGQVLFLNPRAGAGG